MHTFFLHCSGPQGLQVNRCPGNVETLGVGGIPKGIISLRQMPTQGLEKKRPELKKNKKKEKEEKKERKKEILKKGIQLSSSEIL